MTTPSSLPAGTPTPESSQGPVRYETSFGARRVFPHVPGVLKTVDACTMKRLCKELAGDRGTDFRCGVFNYSLDSLPRVRRVAYHHRWQRFACRAVVEHKESGAVMEFDTCVTQNYTTFMGQQGRKIMVKYSLPGCDDVFMWVPPTVEGISGVLKRFFDSPVSLGVQ